MQGWFGMCKSINVTCHINRLDAEKTFDKSQHPFMMKVIREPRHTGELSQHNKISTTQSHSQDHSKWRKTEIIPLKLRSTDVHTLHSSSVQYLKSSGAIRAMKELERMQFGKEQVNASLFAFDSIHKGP